VNLTELKMQQTLMQPILRTDVSGMPLEWIYYPLAVKLYHTNQVAYSCGSPLLTLHGGINAKTGRRSIIEVSSILATYGSCSKLHQHFIPTLNNPTLFRRDAHICMYCGDKFTDSQLSRDHVIPIVKGGQDSWTNVVAACKYCNNKKGGRTPEQAGMSLLAVPFQPTYAEYIYLKGKHILSDQMDFLSAHFPRSSRFLK
jgi:5-methylcytosine-specific restriction endonuclease McrA